MFPVKVSKYLFATTKKGTINEYKKLLYKKQYTHLKVLQSNTVAGIA